MLSAALIQFTISEHRIIFFEEFLQFLVACFPSSVFIKKLICISDCEKRHIFWGWRGCKAKRRRFLHSRLPPPPPKKKFHRRSRRRHIKNSEFARYVVLNKLGEGNELHIPSSHLGISPHFFCYLALKDPFSFLPSFLLVALSAKSEKKMLWSHLEVCKGKKSYYYIFFKK